MIVGSPPFWGGNIIRQELVESVGFHALRFTNDEVIKNLERVIAAITDALNSTLE